MSPSSQVKHALTIALPSSHPHGIRMCIHKLVNLARFTFVLAVHYLILYVHGRLFVMCNLVFGDVYCGCSVYAVRRCAGPTGMAVTRPAPPSSKGLTTCTMSGWSDPSPPSASPKLIPASSKSGAVSLLGLVVSSSDIIFSCVVSTCRNRACSDGRSRMEVGADGQWECVEHNMNAIWISYVLHGYDVDQKVFRYSNEVLFVFYFKYCNYSSIS